MNVDADGLNERERKEIEVFNLALTLASADERADFLGRTCADDPSLREKVEAMLRVHEEADHYFGTASQDYRRALFSDLAGAAQAAGDARPNVISEKPGDRIGRYKLLEKIGEGGFGEVWMAEQREPVKRRVALKVIKPGMDTRQVVARFEAERQALALMDHPNIAKVFDAGATDGGRLYFVMELVRGVKITEYCDRNQLPAADRIRLFILVCKAIQHAHQKGIIHRDIKPSNILVTLHDGVAVPKVIDFGIAKATQGELTDKTLFTQFQQFIGTPAYISPEQTEMSGLDIDTRSDIYSLGVLLYELLAGSTPFDAKELAASGMDAMRKTIREREPVRPSRKLSQTLVAADPHLNSPSSGTPGSEEEIRASSRRLLRIKETILLLRGDLDWIVMKCLEKDRTRRYETANGLTPDLQRHLENEPVLARPPGKLYWMRKLARRHRLAFAAAGGVVLALMAALGISTWSYLRQGKAYTEARRSLYVDELHLAQQAWEHNDIPRFRQILAGAQDFPSHGFEWYYLQEQSHMASKLLLGHFNGVFSVAFSPDGQRIVTGSGDKSAKVWDAASGRELLTLRGHKQGILIVAFSPDGRRIITGSEDGTAKLWDAADGHELVTLRGHSSGILSAASSPDGRRIVTGGEDGTARVWDEANGRELIRVTGGNGRIYSVAFSPDGRRIVMGSDDPSAQVWDAASGRELIRLTGHKGGISSVAFSSDGLRIVTGSSDGTAKLWDATNGRVQRTLEFHSSLVAFSPDGQRVITCNNLLRSKWYGTRHDYRVGIAPRRIVCSRVS